MRLLRLHQVGRPSPIPRHHLGDLWYLEGVICVFLVISLSVCCERCWRVSLQGVGRDFLEGHWLMTRPFQTGARLKKLSPPLTRTEASKERLAGRAVGEAERLKRSLVLYRDLPLDTTR